MKKILVLIVLALSFKGCMEDITIDLPDYDNKVAVYSFLNAGDSPRVYLNLSKSYFDYRDADSSNPLAFIRTATVNIKDLSSGNTSALELKSEIDPFTTMRKYYYTTQMDIKAGQRYELNVQYNGKEVTAETIIPRKVELDKLSIIPVDSNEFEPRYSLFAQWRDQPGEQNAYRVKIMVPDSFYESSTGKYIRSDYVIYPAGFSADRGLEGQVMEQRAEVYLYNGNMADSTRVEVVLENYTQEAADYLRSLNEQENSIQNPLAEPVILNSNVNNGLGIFAGKSPSSIKVIYLK